MVTTISLPHRPAPSAAGAGTKPSKKGNKKKKKVEKEWEHYMGDETLEDNWTRFLHDLGLGEFKSKTQCKKVSCPLTRTPSHSHTHTRSRRQELAALSDARTHAQQTIKAFPPSPDFISPSPQTPSPLIHHPVETNARRNPSSLRLLRASGSTSTIFSLPSRLATPLHVPLGMRSRAKPRWRRPWTCGSSPARRRWRATRLRPIRFTHASGSARRARSSFCWRT